MPTIEKGRDASQATFAVRVAAGLSQVNFGRRLGLADGCRVSQVERGYGTFRSATILRICDEFAPEMKAKGVEPIDFLRVRDRGLLEIKPEGGLDGARESGRTRRKAG